MKKLIPLLSLTLFIGLLSSCIFLPGGYSDNTTPRYTMFFNNASTNQFIYDWYLKDTNNTNYVKSKNELIGVITMNEGEIDSMYLIPFYQKKGYGRILLNIIENEKNSIVV